MAKLILFSGPCNSGKTTTLKSLHQWLFSVGVEARILDEIIRRETDVPIDELRKDAHNYLLLQSKIITDKIELEKIAINDLRNEVWLADRAVTDSLFYLENYVNKNELSEEDIKIFAKLHEQICSYLKTYFKSYCLVQFSPIRNIEEDSFRPKNLSLLQDYEYECINRLNEYYSNYSNRKFMRIDLNAYTKKQAILRIKNFFGL